MTCLNPWTPPQNAPWNNASNKNFPVMSQTGTEPKPILWVFRDRNQKETRNFVKWKTWFHTSLTRVLKFFVGSRIFFVSIFKQNAGKRNVSPTISRHTTYVANVIARPPYAGFVNFSFNGRLHIIYMCMCINWSDNWCTVCNVRCFFWGALFAHVQSLSLLRGTLSTQTGNGERLGGEAVVTTRHSCRR